MNGVSRQPPATIVVNFACLLSRKKGCWLFAILGLSVGSPVRHSYRGTVVG